MKIKALSLWQPWATWIAEGRKTIETRMWSTDYRGPLLICAARKLDTDQMDPDEAKGLPFGKALAVAQLVGCRPMTEADEPAAMCPCEPGRFAWVLTDIQPIREPFAVRGRQKLFSVDVGADLCVRPESEDTMAKKEGGAVAEHGTKIMDAKTGEVLTLQAAADRLEGIAAKADEIRKARDERDAAKAEVDAAKETLKDREGELRDLEGEMNDLVMGQKRLF